MMRARERENCALTDVKMNVRRERFRVIRPSTGVDLNWHVTDGGDLCVAHCFGFAHSVDDGKWLAIRIAAALNYCRGIRTEHLIAHADQIFESEAVRLEAERDR